MSKVTLHCGDCLPWLQTLPDGIADAVITDPPYCSGGYLEAQKNTKAQGLRGATIAAADFHWFSADNMGTSGLVWLLRSVLVECRRVLRPNRSAFIFTDWRMIPNVTPALESSGFRYRNMLVWDKGSAGLGVGFKPAHEIVMEFTNGSTEYAALDGQNVLRAARLHASLKEHGAQKPVQILKELMRVACQSDGTVLDPFLGSGSCGVACVETGRHFFGCELDPVYFQVAERRIAQAQRDDAPLFQAPASTPTLFP